MDEGTCPDIPFVKQTLLTYILTLKGKQVQNTLTGNFYNIWMCLSWIWCLQGILILFLAVECLLWGLWAGPRKDLVPAEIKSPPVLGTAKGLKSFLVPSHCATHQDTPFSHMQWGTEHLPAEVNYSDFLG